MSNFTKTYQLKQHSPIIHFQHDQTGAGLRATEMKPKLDRFLIKEAFNNDFERYKHLLVGFNGTQTKEDFDGKEAFDYKMQIRTGAVKKKYIMDSFMKRNDQSKVKRAGFKPMAPTPYFADTEHIGKGNWDKTKKGLMFEELGRGYEVEVHFFSMKTDLIKKIDQYFNTFLLLNNFGTRQSKGFGSFSDADLDTYQISRMYRSISKKVFSTKLRNNSLEEIFKFIVRQYQILKSGQQKIDSKLNQHYKRIRINGDRVKWEKDVVKDELWERDEDLDLDEYIEAYDNEWFIRALLGLSGHHSYPQENIPIESVKITDMSEHPIERFKSPLTFKPIGDKIFLILQEIPDILYNREFEFQAKPKAKNEGRSPLAIKTPPLKHKLDLYDFIKRYWGRDWEEIR